MGLEDLNKLANDSKANFNKNFTNEDFQLSTTFKDRFSLLLKNKGSEVQYYSYSAEITTSSNNKIYCPNQWFYIATFVVEFVSELINYKQVLENMAESNSNNLTRSQFFNKIKELKGRDPDDIPSEIKQEIDDYFDKDTNSADYLSRFITDYDWWYGNKTIDRGDYFVSPTLNLLGLVNVSQSYVADIANYLASDTELMDSALKLQAEEIKRTNTSSHISENLIVYGAPGTGKSKYIEDNYFNITRVVFHSEYSYYDFIGNYKPSPLYKETNDKLYNLLGKEFKLGEPVINYEFIPGPFISTLIAAINDPEKPFTLLIEELNRANAPAVFGDVFQLLDRNKHGYSQYKIQPNKDLYNYLTSLEGLGDKFEDGLYIPNNLNIVATMNSADQGVFMLDSAFKRRWKFKYMPIQEKGFVHEKVKIEYAGDSYEWRILLNTINEKLKMIGINEDRLIGPYFLAPQEITDNSSFTSKLLIYLWDDVVRYKRQELFNNDFKTYSDVVINFASGVDVLGIKDKLDEKKEIEEENKDKE